MILPLVTALINKQTIALGFSTAATIAKAVANKTLAASEMSVAAATAIGLGTIVAATAIIIGITFAIIKLVGWLKELNTSDYDKKMEALAESTKNLKEELNET